MARPRQDSEPTSPSSRGRAPARTPEQRNNQLIAMSFDAAEEMIRSGKATSQLLTHFLKQGTARDELEKTKLELEGQLLRARTDSLEAGEDIRALYEKAIEVMTEYKGGHSD